MLLLCNGNTPIGSATIRRITAEQAARGSGTQASIFMNNGQ